MSEIGILILLYVVGTLILISEIFIPSHGILSITGVGFLVVAVVKTFQYAGRDAGVVAMLVCMVAIPTMAFVAIKYWHRTPIGRKISPPNPEITIDDVGLPIEQLQRLVGQTGRSVSPLRPVGICDFNGRRVSCVAESGMLDADRMVEGVGVTGGNLTVVEKKV